MTSAVPQPLKHSIYLLGNKYVAKLENTLLADNPLCGLQRPACESFAATRGVSQRNGVRRGIETDLVRSGMAAGAIAAHVDVARITGSLHVIHQFQHRARWRVLLCVVMDLPGPRAVC